MSTESDKNRLAQATRLAQEIARKNPDVEQTIRETLMALIGTGGTDGDDVLQEDYDRLMLIASCSVTSGITLMASMMAITGTPLQEYREWMSRMLVQFSACFDEEFLRAEAGTQTKPDGLIH